MPHVHITCSARMAQALDRPALMRELNALVVEASGSGGVSKASMSPAGTHDEVEGPGNSMFAHVEVTLLPGRLPSVKARLSEAALDILAAHARKAGVGAVTLSLEVRELPGSYRLWRGRAPVSVTGRPAGPPEETRPLPSGPERPRR